MSIYNVQDFSFSCRLITSSGEPFEFKYMVLEMALFEDIFSNFISGYLVVNDSQNFINKLEIVTGAFLIINLDKPGLDEPVDKTFKIYKISNRTLQNETNESYMLHFVSEECLLSEQYKISKSYNGLISDIIYDICVNNLKIGTKKLLTKNFENTSGIREITVPNTKPFQTINWLCSIANSFDNLELGSPFLFYENRDGFNFRSILSLFKNKSYTTFRYEPKNINLPEDDRVQDFNVEYRNIYSYNIVNSMNLLHNIKSGIFSNKLLTIDPLRKKYNSKVFNYTDYFSKTKDLNGNSILPNITNRFGDTFEDTSESVLRFSFTNYGQNDSQYFKDNLQTVHYNNVEFSIPYRNSQLFLLNLNKIKIKVPIDPLLKVGMIVEVLLPDKATNSDSSRNKDEFLSGFYLVTAIKHIINQENAGFSVIECCKDTSSTSVGSYDNSNPGFKLLKDL